MRQRCLMRPPAVPPRACSTQNAVRRPPPWPPPLLAHGLLERCVGIAAPHLRGARKCSSLALELPPPDVIVAEGGNLAQCSAIAACLAASAKAWPTCTARPAAALAMDTIYGGVLALSEFIGTITCKTAVLTAAALTFYITASIPSVSALPPCRRWPCAPGWALAPGIL